MPTNCGELREVLIEAIDAVRHRKIDADEAKAIAVLAQQITANLVAEAGIRRVEKQLNNNGQVDGIGKLSLGVSKT